MAIAGCGSAAPAGVLTNDELAKVVDTSDEWIRTRTGIGQRHLTKPQETLSHLAVTAGQQALVMAGVEAESIDLVILATSTPDDLFGSASKIASLLGASRAVGFDVTAACSGFVFGLAIAAQFIRTGVYQRVLLIGADVLSRWVDWTDRGTCVLFGDGAGAVVCQASPEDRLLGFELYSDGSKNDCLTLSYQGQPRPVGEMAVAAGTYGAIAMNGREVYRFAVEKVPEVIEKALYRANLTAEQVDWLLLHQANQRIIEAVAERLGLPLERTISNLSQYGNTSAASIPLALDEAVRQGKIQPGQVVAASGFGAGL
ncbi:MAG: ketoacyl-ACP synthase III [Chloroflexaceae bacterium]|nr:ketoacyl-ACP synthase III [Chloroflexaceae bacterium]